MKALLQRVSEASVEADGVETAAIRAGLLVFLGVEKGDEEKKADSLARRVAEYRVFPDEEGKTNRSALDLAVEILVVSQFTLCADTKKGRRPSFDPAATPERAEALYSRFVRSLEILGLRVGTGSFGASMKVRLVNEGPATYLLEEKPSVG